MEESMSQRFTDAELAAESWKAGYMTERLYRDNDDRYETELARAATLHRFAALPHGQDEPPTNSRQCSRCSHEIVCPNPVLLDAIMTTHQENGCTLSSSDFPY